MPDGITAATLRSGVTGRASVSVKGKGANLPTPALGLTLPVTVQLVISDGVTTDCWQTTYATAIANDATRFNAKVREPPPTRWSKPNDGNQNLPASSEVYLQPGAAYERIGRRGAGRGRVRCGSRRVRRLA
ncbi:MAG: hypothetical protein E6J77_04145 [Deltaproteobacteria bacterium]|nr:MAG: hypothetical protein E6J77_04145 [Deltaproteobacteria bacterium]